MLDANITLSLKYVSIGVIGVLGSATFPGRASIHLNQLCLKILSLRFLGPTVYYAHTSTISISPTAVSFNPPIRPFKRLNNEYKKKRFFILTINYFQY